MRQRYGKRQTERERFDKGETETEIDKFSMNQRQIQSERGKNECARDTETDTKTDTETG